MKKAELKELVFQEKLDEKNLWIDKNGEAHDIPSMGDAHLWAVMEALTKLARMNRRIAIDTLSNTLAEYNFDHFTTSALVELQSLTESTYDSIITMNTDAFGKEFVPHYEPIMIEAAKRKMRDPFNPDYSKDANAN